MRAISKPQQPKVPSLKHHKASGQGYVRINGRVSYLGRVDLPETRQKYHRLIAEWMAGGYHLRRGRGDHHRRALHRRPQWRACHHAAVRR